MSVHLVKGEDPILRSEVVDRLIADLVGDDDRSLAVEEFTIPGKASRGAAGAADASGDDGGDGAPATDRESIVGAALLAAQCPPFMTGLRIIVVRDVGNLTAADGDAFLTYLDDPMETTALVLVAGGGRTPANLAKGLKAAKVDELGPVAEKTSDVLADHVSTAGLKLDGDAAKAVSAHLGEDAGRVPQLVEVWAAAFPSGAKLGLDDVEPYLGEAGGVPSYLLTNAIETGDVAGALETLHRMTTATSPQQPKPMHPLQVLGMLTSYYRRLLRLDDPEVRSPAEAVEALGGRIKEYPARKALDLSRALGTSGIREAFDHLATADLDLKGARGIPEDAVMEVLVARLAALSGRSRRGGRSRR